jgi:acetyl-CoA carboxylase biotin carboxyl carrier protein
MELKPGELQEILKIFVDSELQELQLQVGDVMLSVSKNDAGMSSGVAVQPQPRTITEPAPPSPTENTAAHVESAAAVPGDASARPAVDRPGLYALRSPSVGVFYRRPGPDEPPYVEVGDEVMVGDPVCTISVMKMFTEVQTDRAGRVVEVCVENETLVEHAQVLMYIEPIDRG